MFFMQFLIGCYGKFLIMHKNYCKKGSVEIVQDMFL